ncbi:MAG: sigma-54-dependent Fis family transcriptional regulator [Nitrospirota bacterium]|nr:sigma-54-dependent Fis family transcriptional regulator [Nitrospirota bacterium]MDE3243616.1 sigma-54-dependent Fis family transcriptional regulator [Nitrospirota bacterium]
MKPKVLIVDDDPDIVTILRERLDALGYETCTASDGLQGLERIEREQPDLILLDLEMPHLSGLELLKRLSQIRQQGREGADAPVIVMTAYGTITKAVEAMQEGAYDFLAKPIEVDHLSVVLRKVLERESLKRQVACLKTDVDSRYAGIIGTSRVITEVMELARRAANSDANILLLGESGTGKELFARSIHQWSPRRSMPFVVINCVALTETLLENELFGHERGAFTGADRQQKGKMEMADGGTVFLDEIGDMPLSLQAKLLRFLQDHEFHRVGGTRLVRVNIRVVAATNKDLKQAVRAGSFREDLYFRLNVVTLTLPPLRNRPEDIPLLADFFLARHAREAKRPHLRFSAEALSAITEYAWPGNIRELENAVARAVVLSPQEVIPPQPLGLSHSGGPSEAGGEGRAGHDDALPYHESMERHSRAIILQALRQTNGSQTKAAERLQLQRTYLARLIKQKGISGSRPCAG